MLNSPAQVSTLKNFGCILNFFLRFRTLFSFILVKFAILASEKPKILALNKSFSDILFFCFFISSSNLMMSLILFKYHLSIKQGINPDFPKNLAKVVTVE